MKDRNAESAIIQDRLSQYDRALRESEQTRHKLMNGIIWKSGELMVNATRSPLSFLMFPVCALSYWFGHFKNKAAHKPSSRSVSQVRALDLYDKGGIEQAISYLSNENIPAKQLADICLTLAHNLDYSEKSALGELAALLEGKDIGTRRLFDFAALMVANGHISWPYRLTRGHKAGRFNVLDRTRLKRIEGLNVLRTAPPSPSAGSEALSYTPVNANSLLYILATAGPDHHSGYTMRSQNVISGLRQQGWAVHCVTRPGYPFDRTDVPIAAKNDTALRYTYGGTDYTRLPSPRQDRERADHYIEKAADALEKLIREHRPRYVMAASNYLTAYPAMLAAKKVGVPFIYEVRNVWEYAAASKHPGWEGSEKFTLDQDMDNRVMLHADCVVTLGTNLRDHLVGRGVPAEKIYIAHNCVDTDLFRPAPAPPALAHRIANERFDIVLGYMGTASYYEGLDDLFWAIALLKARNIRCGLVFVGDGDEIRTLPRKARRAGIADQVIMTGMVEQHEIASYMSAVDCAVLPRKDFPLCHIVTPLKPIEAMSMGLPLITSDVRPLKDLVEAGKAGLTFPAGDITALANAIEDITRNTERRKEMGRNAKAHSERFRQDTVMNNFSNYLKGMPHPHQQK